MGSRVGSICVLPAAFALAVGSASGVNGPVVARVGEVRITRTELDEAASSALNAGYYHRLSPERLVAVERTALDELVRAKLDLLGGLERGLELPMATARQDRAEIEERLGNAAYRAALRARSWDPEAHTTAIAEKLLATRARQLFVADQATVSDVDVRAAYDAAPQRWLAPEALHLEHILLRVPPGESDVQVAARQAEALSLLEEIKGGVAFAEVATRASEDLYRIRGGDLGWVHRGRLIEPLESAAWQAVPGELIGPLRSPEGFHLLRVIERRPSRYLRFAEAEPMIRAELEAKRLAEAEERWYGTLRAKYPVEILDPALAPAAP